MTRRSLAIGGLGGVLAVGAGVAKGVLPGRAELKSQYHGWFSPQPHIPTAPEGEIKLVQVYSHTCGQTVDLFTAVPHGHGDGAGLPVCVVRSDPLYSDVRTFVSALPQRPQIVSYGPGAHTRAYWDSVTLPAFRFVGAAL